MPIGR